jgi:hypothetical protein
VAVPEASRVRAVTELESPWNAVHDALPAGWTVNRLGYNPLDDRWHIFATDHRPRRKRPDYIESVGIPPPHPWRPRRPSTHRQGEDRRVIRIERHGVTCLFDDTGINPSSPE